ncbi:CRISPR-associated endonuclease Cas1 [Streptococcus anginosus]|uniref:CRISPR-associated endonuclease Cas1 n=1 Tax=Streptococcus anginosus TaxID=1328 RepID=UPI00200092C2|nr:CRISPR-associated endonuclease Cas1 [Streptococcus anginosus]
MGDLYIQKSDYHLSLSNDRVIIKDNEKNVIKEVSLSLIENILVFGKAQLTTQLLAASANNRINVFYFSGYGKFLSVLDSGREADYEKQEKQALSSFNQEFCLEIAKRIASAKIRNQLNLLKAFDEEHILDSKDFEQFQEAILGISTAKNIPEIMGFEGRIAKSYFYLLNFLLTDDFRFYERSKRPSKDRFNALLNFGYSILHSCFIGIIRKNGLSLGFGVIHRPHQHHSVLASDLMEEWRPVIVDDTIMSLIKNEEIRAEHFEEGDEEEVVLTAEGIEIFSKAMRSRVLEIHQYIEFDKKRYSFLYMADQQIKSLIRCFETENHEEFLSGYTTGE